MAVMDTYRLSHIPEWYTAEDIRALFSTEDQSLIIGPISLAPSVYADEAKLKVATISFRAIPACVQRRLKEPEAKQDKSISGIPSTEDNPKRQKFDWSLRDVIDTEKAQMMRIDNQLEGLTPLNEWGDGDGTTVDIVASTGLAGRAFGSWQHPDGAMWLRDYLPRDVQGVRVFIWGQTSRLEDSHSHMDIHDLTKMLLQDLVKLRQTAGERPLVLIGHSLGGIIIKAVSVEASQEEEFKFLSRSIQGFVFFGTPHQGMVTEHWEKLWGNDPPQTLIRTLSTGSPYLKQLADIFQRSITDIDIISCFEREESPTVRRDESGKARRDGPPELYVPPHSACLGYPREKQIPINANHSAIAKLSDSDGGQYHTVKGYLADMLKDIRTRVQKRHVLENAILVLEETRNFLRFSLTNMSKVDSLVMNELNEVQTLQNALKTATLPVLDDSFKEAVADLELINYKFMKKLRGEDKGSFESSDDGLYRIDDALPRRDDTRDPATLTDLAEQAIMPLLHLGWSLQSNIGTLEKFMVNRSFDHPGLDMIALQQRKLDTKLADLNPFDGRCVESETPINGLKLGIYYPGNGSRHVDVLLETRDYTENLVQYTDLQRSAAIDNLHEGAHKLASHMKSGLPDRSDMSHPQKLLQHEILIFQCLGWKHDRESQRFIFLYRIPRPLRACFKDIKDNIMTLGTWVTRVKTIKPYLEELFSTAYQICRTVFSLHTSGWLHKNINPENIILIPRPEEGKSEVSVERRTHFLVPYLKGFEFSRSRKGYSDREAAKDTEFDVYRHPSRQGQPDSNETFGPVHDIYAVGVVLLEIGRGKRAEDYLKSKGKLPKGRKAYPSEIRDQLSLLAKTDLPSYVGTRYAKCVQRCLMGLNDDNDDDDDAVEHGGTSSVFAFRRQIVDELRRMALACGTDI